MATDRHPMFGRWLEAYSQSGVNHVHWFEETPDKLIIRLTEDSITDDAELHELTNELSQVPIAAYKKIVLDLSGVERLSSF